MTKFATFFFIKIILIGCFQAEGHEVEVVATTFESPKNVSTERNKGSLDEAKNVSSFEKVTHEPELRETSSGKTPSLYQEIVNLLNKGPITISYSTSAPTLREYQGMFSTLQTGTLNNMSNETIEYLSTPEQTSIKKIVTDSIQSLLPTDATITSMPTITRNVSSKIMTTGTTPETTIKETTQTSRAKTEMHFTSNLPILKAAAELSTSTEFPPTTDLVATIDAAAVKTPIAVDTNSTSSVTMVTTGITDATAIKKATAEITDTSSAANDVTAATTIMAATTTPTPPSTTITRISTTSTPSTTTTTSRTTTSAASIITPLSSAPLTTAATTAAKTAATTTTTIAATTAVTTAASIITSLSSTPLTTAATTAAASTTATAAAATTTATASTTAAVSTAAATATTATAATTAAATTAAATTAAATTAAATTAITAATTAAATVVRTAATVATTATSTAAATSAAAARTTAIRATATRATAIATKTISTTTTTPTAIKTKDASSKITAVVAKTKAATAKTTVASSKTTLAPLKTKAVSSKTTAAATKSAAGTTKAAHVTTKLAAATTKLAAATGKDSASTTKPTVDAARTTTPGGKISTTLTKAMKTIKTTAGTIQSLGVKAAKEATTLVTKATTIKTKINAKAAAATVAKKTIKATSTKVMTRSTTTGTNQGRTLKGTTVRGTALTTTSKNISSKSSSPEPSLNKNILKAPLTVVSPAIEKIPSSNFTIQNNTEVLLVATTKSTNKPPKSERVWSIKNSSKLISGRRKIPRLDSLMKYALKPAITEDPKKNSTFKPTAKTETFIVKITPKSTQKSTLKVAQDSFKFSRKPSMSPILTTKGRTNSLPSLKEEPNMSVTSPKAAIKKEDQYSNNAIHNFDPATENNFEGSQPSKGKSQHLKYQLRIPPFMTPRNRLNGAKLDARTTSTTKLGTLQEFKSSDENLKHNLTTVSNSPDGYLDELNIDSTQNSVFPTSLTEAHPDKYETNLKTEDESEIPPEYENYFQEPPNSAQKKEPSDLPDSSLDEYVSEINNQGLPEYPGTDYPYEYSNENAGNYQETSSEEEPIQRADQEEFYSGLQGEYPEYDRDEYPLNMAGIERPVNYPDENHVDSTSEDSTSKHTRVEGGKKWWESENDAEDWETFTKTEYDSGEINPDKFLLYDDNITSDLDDSSEDIGDALHASTTEKKSVHIPLDYPGQDPVYKIIKSILSPTKEPPTIAINQTKTTKSGLHSYIENFSKKSETDLTPEWLMEMHSIPSFLARQLINCAKNHSMDLDALLSILGNGSKDSVALVQQVCGLRSSPGGGNRFRNLSEIPVPPVKSLPITMNDASPVFTESRYDAQYLAELIDAQQEYRRLHQATEFDVKPWLRNLARVKAEVQVTTSRLCTFPGLGCNAYSYSMKKDKDPSEIAADWYAESEGYNFNVEPDLERNPYVGLFTQMVWRDTMDIGCGRCEIDDERKINIVCLYAPPGNEPGMFRKNVLPILPTEVAMGPLSIPPPPPLPPPPPQPIPIPSPIRPSVMVSVPFSPSPTTMHGPSYSSYPPPSDKKKSPGASPMHPNQHPLENGVVGKHASMLVFALSLVLSIGF